MNKETKAEVLEILLNFRPDDPEIQVSVPRAVRAMPVVLTARLPTPTRRKAQTLEGA